MPGIYCPAGQYVGRTTATIMAGQTYTWLGYMRFISFPRDAFGGNVFGEFINYGLGSTGAGVIEGLKIRTDGLMLCERYGGVQSDVLTVSLHTWYAVAFVRSTTNFKVYIRKDGDSTSNPVDVTESQASRPNWDQLNVGEPGCTFEVAQALIRLYEGRALSQSEVEAEWDSVTPVSTTNLWADYQFVNDGTRTTRVADSSGNGRDLSDGPATDVDWKTPYLPAVYAVENPYTGGLYQRYRYPKGAGNGMSAVRPSALAPRSSNTITASPNSALATVLRTDLFDPLKDISAASAADASDVAAFVGNGQLATSSLDDVITAAALTGPGAVLAFAVTEVDDVLTLLGYGVVTSALLTEADDEFAATGVLSADDQVAGYAEADDTAEASLSGIGAVTAYSDADEASALASFGEGTAVANDNADSEGAATIVGAGVLTLVDQSEATDALSAQGPAAVAAVVTGDETGEAQLSAVGTVAAVVHSDIVSDALVSGVGALVLHADVAGTEALGVSATAQVVGTSFDNTLDSAGAVGAAIIVCVSVADLLDALVLQGLGVTTGRSFGDVVSEFAAYSTAAVTGESSADDLARAVFYGAGDVLGVGIADDEQYAVAFGMPANEEVFGFSYGIEVSTCEPHGIVLVRGRIRCDELIQCLVLAGGMQRIVRPSGDRQIFSNSGELLPRGPLLPPDFMLAPDLARFPQWRRLRGDEWSTAEYRRVVFDWLIAFFASHAWARRWDIREVATSPRSVGRLRDVRLVIGISDKRGTRVETVISFAEALLSVSELRRGLSLAEGTLDTLYASVGVT